ncbi:hypothetical protein BMF94_5477 [Rhodotorula taiwanensis]|uniref:Shr3 amino acid permease chaperone n=1 Tax=Rhodotorula taiwanensis TaxID=741276 RepID=A0A2S5B317_9BASI|nr:hypothetical protein BMF94_5477 [Rhodotorula taiwanensis]
MGFLTAAATVSAAFLVGTLFTSLLWDATVLYGLTEPINERMIEAVENYYLTWWNGGMAVKMFMHIVMIVLFLSLVAKWARRSETAFYFSGASILALVCAAAMYITITLPSIRIIARDPLSKSAFIIPGDDFFTRMQGWLAARSTGSLGTRARENAAALAQLEPMGWVGRVQHVQVLCAANTINMVLLFLIVVLQVSEWYLDETILKENELEARKQAAAALGTAAAATTAVEPTSPAGKKAVTKEKKKQ